MAADFQLTQAEVDDIQVQLDDIRAKVKVITFPDHRVVSDPIFDLLDELSAAVKATPWSAL